MKILLNSIHVNYKYTDIFVTFYERKKNYDIIFKYTSE